MVVRSDAAFCCSGACRQKAYRIRKKARAADLARAAAPSSGFAAEIDAKTADIVRARTA